MDIRIAKKIIIAASKVGLIFIVLFNSLLTIPSVQASTSSQKSPILVSNDQFVFHPSLYGFDIQEFLSKQPGVLKDYHVDISGQKSSATEIIEAAAFFYSINPQIILALLETQSSLISDPNPDNSRIKTGMGVNIQEADGFSDQIYLAMQKLFFGIYSKASIDKNGITILDEDAATSAINIFFIDTTSSQFSKNSVDLQISKFVTYFTSNFGDPTSLRNKVPFSITQIPDFHYPWPTRGSAIGWKQVGGPHYNSGWPLADGITTPGGNYPTGLDFVPPHSVNVFTASAANPCNGRYDSRPECREANRGIDRMDWVVASATGDVVYSGFSQAVVQHNSEWGSLYYHIATEDRAQPGPLPSDLRIGHPSSEANQGGYSTESHVHFSILYGGVFQSGRSFQDIRQFSLSEWENSSAVGVTAYEDANYGGRSLTLTQSDEDLCDNLITGSTTNPNPCFDQNVLTWNDRISSIKVAPGYQAILLLHSKDWDIDQYGQAQARFACNSDIPDFSTRTFDGTSISLNDNVSKIIIGKCTGSSSVIKANMPTSSPCDPEQPPSETDAAIFVSDITLPDGTVVSPAQSLTKIWRMKNTGSSTWGNGYKLVFVDAEQMGAPTSVDVAATTPGQEVDISVPMTAPSTDGEHIGKWRLRNPQGTYFGPVVWVKIKVNSPISGGNITLFDVTPTSPSSASQVHIVGRVRYFSDFRSMRIKIGNEVHEKDNFKQIGDQLEMSFDWNTSSLPRTTYAIVFEVAKQGDNDWASPERQVKTYTLTGSPASNNHPPDRPLLKSPYNWYLKDASGGSASVELCVYPASDPDGDSIQYGFEVKDQGGGVVATSGWTSSTCWNHTFNPGTYSWRAKAYDGSAESDWGQDTWNFSVAGGDVSIGEYSFFDLNTNNTHLCVFVTYGGIQGPDVYAWLNKAPDGSENGEWRLLDHYGPNTTPDCTQPNYHGFWIRSPEYVTGNHLLKITAIKRDSNASATKMTSYNIIYIRPSDPVALAPSSFSNNGTWWNTRTINFQWGPSLRADNYTLRASTNSNPWADPSPILNQVLPSGTVSYTHAFSQDYAQLYWAVRASNSAGTADTPGGSWFGIDMVKPTCQVQALSSVTYENVFQVNWSGADNSAGVRAYDIQYRDTNRDNWNDWLLNQPVSHPYELFNGQPGHSYYFRCRAIDNAGNVGNYPANADTSIKVDPSARPPAPWWNSAYSYKRNLTILNNMASVTMGVGYPVHLHFDSGTSPTAAELYNASQTSTKCNDLRIIYNDVTELDRLVERCDSSAIDVWFRSQVSIAGSTSNSTAHQLYYGNSAAGSPPASRNQVLYPVIDGNTKRMYDMREGSGFILHDAAGYGDATMSSAMGWSQNGKFGPGVLFPGDGGPEPRPAVDDGSSNLPVSSFTIEFWLKRINNYDYVIAGRTLQGYNPSWSLVLRNNGLYLSVWPWPGAGGTDVHSNGWLDGTTFFNHSHHFAVTFNGGNEVRFYFDGRLDSVKYLSQNGLSSSSSPLRIGASDVNSMRLGAIMSGFSLSEGVRIDFSYGLFADITSEPSVAAGQPQTPPASGSPDLIVLDLSAYPNPGGGTLVQAMVKNQGTLDTMNGFFTDIYVDHIPTGAGDYTGSLQFWVNEPIPAGQTLTLTTVLDTMPVLLKSARMPLAPGSEITGTLYAQTDSTGALSEPNKTNNIYSTGTEICVATADAFETDDTAPTASLISINAPQAHNFDGPGDKDWIKFNAQAGIQYTIQTYNLGSSTDTYLYLYGPDSTTLLASNDDAGGTLASRIEWTAPEAGTYYLLVQHWNPNIGGCRNAYTISLEGPKIYLPLIRRQ